jgi:hypothetical protein
MNISPKLIILSMPRSPRLFYLKERLRKLGINYHKIFYGNLGETKGQRKIIYQYYNKKKVESFIGRQMTFNEIGAEYTTLRVYNYIVKNKILNAIIMHDDIYPSILLKKWIDNKIYLKGLNIIGFFCSPNGFFRKISEYSFLKKKVFLHKAKTHVYISNCMQINYDFCRYYLEKTKNKVCGQNDFSFNFKKAGINVFQTFPLLAYPDDRGHSYIRDERNIIEKPLISIKYKLIIRKYKFLRQLLYLIRTFYYLSFLPFLFKKYSYAYYKEYFFDKYKISFTNFFSKKYLDSYKFYINKKNYPRDLYKFIHHFY